MHKTHVVSLVLASSYLTLISAVPKDYLHRRKNVLDRESSLRAGGTLSLTTEEVKVNTILMQEKRKEIETSRLNGTIFPPAINFMISKPAYEASKVFQIIRRMPKGGSLHLHSYTLPTIDWIVKNLTYRSNCYMCTDSKGTLLFHFYQTQPTKSDCQWRLVSEVRRESNNVTAFNERIYNSMSLTVPNPESVYITNDDVWVRFSETFSALYGLLGFAGAVRDIMYEALKQVYDDNIMYMEIRGLSSVYDLHGANWDLESVLKINKEVIADFKTSYPDFIGVKYIISTARTDTNTEMRSMINETIKLREKYPDDIVGFDIGNNENKGRPDMDFVDDLLYPSTLRPPVDLPYYFHAGETDWIGTQVDDDILDAILLGTKRIGHGFALHGHPEFLRLVKEKNIAIEVNPISNQVLKLIRDLRVHPAVSLLAQDFPVVISSDDPNTWGALPASHDFYAAFMALGGATADLRFLKQLAMNSIIYSAMGDCEKTRALSLWRKKWNIFINDVIKTEWEKYKSATPDFIG